MCVFYRKLNGITKPFYLTTPLCYDTISTLGAGLKKIWIVSLDARQVYHQISVRNVDREK